MKFINEHLNQEKDGINITTFNKEQYSLEFYLTSNKNQKFELQLYDYYGPKFLKFEFIKEKLDKYTEISKKLNKSYGKISDFFKKIDELYKSKII